VGSIPIARSTFRCLACPCVVLGRDLAYRPVPTVSTRLQFIWSNASIGLLVEFVLDGLIGPSSGRLRKFEMAPAGVGQKGTLGVSTILAKAAIERAADRRIRAGSYVFEEE
jgi:hypothetical protein